MGNFLDYLNPISAAVNAVTGVVDVVDTLTGGKSHRARKQARYQAQLEEEAALANFERSKEMWNMENEYNLPVNQMQRYQDAGINPNMAISGITQQPIAMNPVQQNAPDYNSAYQAQIQQSQQMLNSMKQIADVALIKSQADNVQADTKLKEKDISWYDRLREVEWNEKDSQAFKNDAERQYYYTQRQVAEETIFQIRESVNELKSKISNTNQQTLNLLQQFCQNEQSFEKLLKNLDMDIAVKGAQINQLRASCQLILAEATGQNLRNSFQRQENAFGAKIFNDRVSAYRFNRGLLGFQYESQSLKMPAVRNIGGLNVYLDTTQQGLNVLNSALDVPNKILDLEWKPVDKASNLLPSLLGSPSGSKVTGSSTAGGSSYYYSH